MIHGIIPVNKPCGLSSAKAVARVKHILHVKKAGHTGTLDPEATGLLVCGINKGTKLSRFLLNGTKTYSAGIHLGIETDTLDASGRVVNTCDTDTTEIITKERVLQTLEQFIGQISQEPPVYSALKHKGQPLYRLARAGTPVVKPPRDVKIFNIRLVEMMLPLITIEVHCTAGTYIRSLARDIGRHLGCGAHLSALCRTECCGLTLKEAVSLADLEAMDRKTAQAQVVSLTDSLPDMPLIQADDKLMETIKFGREIKIRDYPQLGQELHKSPFLRICDRDRALAAIVEYNKARDRFKYSCVFAG
ncbi:MAG: tRNA pseudouridine(55) synthase TruB [Thermodesulfobacteriota bacterium]|nr:tRNA pseudouridine(55) synthase TruB [Thermodesulfobacteriota bacterium]